MIQSIPNRPQILDWAAPSNSTFERRIDIGYFDEKFDYTSKSNGVNFNLGVFGVWNARRLL